MLALLRWRLYFLLFTLSIGVLAVLNLVFFSATRSSHPAVKMAQQLVDKEIKENLVVMFSKSYCPYCKMAKESLTQAGVEFKAIEIENRG